MAPTSESVQAADHDQDTGATDTATATATAELPREAVEANAALATAPADADAAADPSPGFVVYNGPYEEPKWQTDLGPTIRMAAICFGLLIFLMAVFAGIIWWLESGTGAA